MLFYLFLSLLAAAPQSGLLQQGLVALQHNQLAEARKDLEQASQADPKNAYVWSSLAETYLRLDERERAFAAAAKAEHLDAGNPIVAHALALFYLDSGDGKKAVIFAELAAKKNPTAAAIDLLGRALIIDGESKEGIAQLALAWKQAQANPHIAFDYADALLHEEDFTQAADVLTTTRASNPKDAQLTIALGVARYGQRRFSDAIELFLTTIQLDPTAERPYVFLGKMLDQAGPRLPEITADYERWVKTNPDNAQAQLLLAKALLSADPHSERAFELLDRSVKLDTNNWQAHYELGVLLENRKDYEAAAKELAAAAQISPGQPMPHYRLARVYDRLGQVDRARTEREIHRQLTMPAPKQ